MILAALVYLAARPPVATTISYDFRAISAEAKGPMLEVRVTERFDAVRPDGTYEASRSYSEVKAKGEGDAVQGIDALAGMRDEFTVGMNGEWVQTGKNVALGFPDFPMPSEAVPVGQTWNPGRSFSGVKARLKETRRIAGREAAVIDFPAEPRKEGETERRDQVGPGSHWVMDLKDGRPLFVRLELIDANPAHSGVFTLVRRDVPGLVPKL